MALASLQREDKLGLAVAVVLHVGLLAAFLMQPEAESAPMPDRMTVNLAEDVGLEAVAPVPVLESRASTSPEVTDTISAEPPMPEVVERPVEMRPVPSTKPRPSPRTEAPRETRREAPRPTPTSNAGGSRRFDQAFAGAGSSESTSETRVPASQIGASAKASLLQGIVREVKPHWQPPSGPEVDQLVSKVRFRLNPDGSLAGRPQLVSQRGESATNAAQAGRHGEQAIRAVQLAAPFDLPSEYYEAWKTVTLDFDWKLAQ